MKPTAFDYVAPRSVEEALAALAKSGGGAKVLAGGQTLMPLLALRMSLPTVLVDINKVVSLKGVSHSGGKTRIGAMTRQSELISDPTLATSLPVLVRAARHIGHHQTRNRGTLGGSISLGEPAAELPAAAVALGAEIVVRSHSGSRTISAEDFYLGPYVTALGEDELVAAVHFPDWPRDTIQVFHEVTRRPGDFALVGVVGALSVERGRVARTGLALFGMGPTPIKARRAEALLMGQQPAQIDFAAVAEAAIEETDPFDDHHASAEYRRTVGRRVVARALRESMAPVR